MAIDITTGKFLSGKKYIAFRELAAAAGEQQLLTKDDTLGKQHFQVYSAWLACGSGAMVNVFDGSSSAVPLLSLKAGDTSIGGLSQSWDFEKDPLDCTREDGTSICISAVGAISGLIKWGWGN
jgi:hypothetical protein